MKKHLFIALSALVFAASVFWFTACRKDNPVAPQAATTAAEDRSANSTVYPRNAHPHGKSYEEWSVSWWKWALAIPYATNPMFDATGVNAGMNQSGPVYYLAGFNGGPTTRNITVPHGKNLFFPIFNVIIDYPCPDPNWQPAPGQTLEELLTSFSWLMDSVDVVTLTLDGTTLSNPFDYRVKSSTFRFTGDPSLTAPFDACITGTEQDGWSDGFWIMLKPLQYGQHTLHFYGAVTNWNWVQDVTYNITVE